MDDFTSSLTQQFNFKPKYIKKLKYMYICYTDKGTKLIKPVSNSVENIEFIHKVKQHLKAQNFNNIDFYHITKDGLPYVLNEDITYVMTDYIECEECNFKNEKDILNSIKCIASFHKFCQGTQPPLNEEETYWIDIKLYYEKKLQSLKKMKKYVSKQKSLTDFDFSFIKNYNYFFENALKSIEILEKYNYKILKKEACKKLMICHNKLKEESILIKNDKVFLYNMENISINHYVNDLYKFFIRYIRKHETNTLTFEKILNEYIKINHIENNIFPILYAMLLFPERYIETCENFYERKRSFTPISISSQMENILYLKEYHSNFISSIKPN